MAGIGFIGLGVMGRPMTAHILRRISERGDWVLSINDVDQARVVALLDAGAIWADTPREVAEASDVVIVMVPDIPNIRALVDGPAGLAAGVTSPTVLVVSSTVSPDGVRDLDADLRERTDGL